MGDLQALLKNDKRALSGADPHQAEMRLLVTQRVHRQEIAAARRSKLKLQEQLLERKEENMRLQEQLRVLEASVAVRRTIASARDAGGGDAGATSASSRRMRQVVVRR